MSDEWLVQEKLRGVYCAARVYCARVALPPAGPRSLWLKEDWVKGGACAAPAMSEEWQVKEKRRGGCRRVSRCEEKPEEGQKHQRQPQAAPRGQPHHSAAEALQRQRYQAPSAGFASEVQRSLGARTAAPAAAEEAVRQLQEAWPCVFFVLRIWVPAVARPDAPPAPQNAFGNSVHSRILPHVKPSGFTAEGIVIGKVVEGLRDAPNDVWLGVLTWLEPEAAKEAISAYCMQSFQAGHDAKFSRPDAWRFLDNHAFSTVYPSTQSRKEQEPRFTGEPLAFEIASGPHSHLPDELDDLDGPKQVRACSRRFVLPGNAADINQAARSKDTTELQQLLRRGLTAVFVPDARGITPLHLAALSGNITVARAAAERARLCPARSWRDRDGRTPLHYAAFFDSPGLVRALWGLGEHDAKDRWGRTAADLASGLGHRAAAAALAQEPQPLQQLCEQRVLRLLRGTPSETAAALGKMQALPSGLSLRSCVPLHEHSALQRLAEAAPGDVDPSDLLRSMSCTECWYADLLNCGCGPAVPGCLELIPVWNELEAFQGGEAEKDTDGKLLVRSPADAKVSPLADRKTFMERFHRRTGGVLAAMDWSNVMVIGGMVLACLTATDEEYARNYKETDVDIYVVGLTGKAFHQRVVEVVSALPRTPGEGDYHYVLKHDFTLPVKRAVKGLLVEEGPHQKREKGGLIGANRPNVPRQGDLIIQVDFVDAPELMEQQLERREVCSWDRSEIQPHVLKVRPREAIAASREGSSTLLRTPQTLTAVLRDGSGKPLPNVQVVLAPYASPAHLLFTTDIDCVAMGFDGKHLLATPRAREALRRRRNIARPEKYAVRGEWRTEARLLKYASRGFRVVDIGLRPGAKAPPCPEAAAAAKEAADSLKLQEGGQVEAFVRRVRDSGVHGARLLMLATRDLALLRLMLHEEPLLRAGTDRESLVKLVSQRRTAQPQQQESDSQGNSDVDDDDLESARVRRGGGPTVNPEGNLEMEDGYGRAAFGLLMVNPSRQNGHRVQDGHLRGKEVPLTQAIEELNLEADRFEVRSWYEGLREEDLQPSATLDPQTWRGIGDFRAAA